LSSLDNFDNKGRKVCCKVSLYKQEGQHPLTGHRAANLRLLAIGQSVSRTQASDAMTSQLPRYEAQCVQRRCFQSGPVPLRSDIKGTVLSPANIIIDTTRKAIDCATTLPLALFI